MQTAIAVWCYEGPGNVQLEMRVETKRQLDESAEAWAARHAKAVAAQQEIFVPVPKDS